MKIATAKLTNYWKANSDPDFVDVRVRLMRKFGAKVGDVIC